MSSNTAIIRIATLELGEGTKAEEADVDGAHGTKGEEPEEVEPSSDRKEGTDNKKSQLPATLAVSKSITQIVHVCAEHKKPRKLIKYIEKIREAERKNGPRQPAPMLIFCSKIKTLRFVAEFLLKQGVKCEMIHSQLVQSRREKALNDFKCGKVPVLVGTDVASRGLHVKRLSYVVNYDFPANLELYCHRIGRTGRQGAKGESFSFLTRGFAPLAKDLVMLLESCDQDVDPNLRQLAEGKDSKVGPLRKESSLEDDDQGDDPEDDDIEDDEDVAGGNFGGGLQIRPGNRQAESDEEEQNDDDDDEDVSGGTFGGGLQIRPGKRKRVDEDEEDESADELNAAADDDGDDDDDDEEDDEVSKEVAKTVNQVMARRSGNNAKEKEKWKGESTTSSNVEVKEKWKGENQSEIKDGMVKKNKSKQKKIVRPRGRRGGKKNRKGRARAITGKESSRGNSRKDG
eukprot:gnl/MRDRNA2_/MRDRNA2_27428_c0_seq1.p1 gnl/MRDRNA2_/MRDRNA2_27428_c0~~gnl/MRDRNA2_/MRDRNA2_27428_c0_seq1.p1  ORF type:complete len:504 (-),score=156.62 gnl/MRDRNA2_/MRDRNA2_27428_c0_seq1:109-1479(-)